jgi:aspartate aminotransferase-like enzyme
VRAAFRRPVVYHRADEFRPLYDRVRRRLSRMVGGTPVGLFVGSGTLANEAVAAALAADPERENGLILAAGEFGGRLVAQARRWGLRPRVLGWDWGRAWDLDRVADELKRMPPGGWVWAVHHETSTGVLNDLPGLVAVAGRSGRRVCVDCVSSLGAVDIDLRGVYLATGASGKAVGSYAGLAFVFADPAAVARLDPDRVPAYLDVAAAVAADGPRFTVPSPPVAALDAALARFATAGRRAARYAELAELGGHVRRRLRAAGIEPLAADPAACPAVVTFAPPGGLSSAAFVARCGGWGYQIAGQSGYLAGRRLVQLAVMGAVTRADLAPLLDRLAG